MRHFYFVAALLRSLVEFRSELIATDAINPFDAAKLTVQWTSIAPCDVSPIPTAFIEADHEKSMRAAIL